MWSTVLCVLLLVIVVALWARYQPILFLFRERHTMPPATSPALWYTQPPYPSDSHQDLGDHVVV